MVSDLTKRLRAAAERKWPEDGDRKHSLFGRAADEIERLERELEEWKDAADDMAGPVASFRKQRDEAVALIKDLQGWLNDKRRGTWRYMEGSEVYEDQHEWLARIDALLAKLAG
jgi:hypothetical protein